MISALSIVLSIILTNFVMETFSEGINVQGLAVAMLMPLLLGTPTIAIILYKQEQLRDVNRRLEHLATIDWLTGCLNRGTFTARISEWLRSPLAKGAMLVVDVDHFKSINDRYGHDRGDDALKLIANTLARALGKGEVLGRLGGEEFGIVLPWADESQARMRAEALRDAVSRLGFVAEGRRCPLSISIGGVAFSGANDFRTLYRLADSHLYQAKAAGRDQVALTIAA